VQGATTNAGLRFLCCRNTILEPEEAVSRIDDDACILEAATKGPWDAEVIAEGMPVENALFAATARNRMHLYLALGRVAKCEFALSELGVCEPGSGYQCPVCAALADIEAPDEPKETDNAPE